MGVGKDKNGIRRASRARGVWGKNKSSPQRISVRKKQKRIGVRGEKSGSFVQQK